METGSVQMTLIGEEIRRKEDVRLVTGQGQYADDLRFENTAYAVFARSPHAHAIIESIDVSAALEADGVLAVMTGADVVAAGIKPIPHIIGSSKGGSDVPLKNHDGSERARTPHLPLPTDKVRFVGEAYAMVVAETIEAAKDAAEMIDAEWTVLPSVTRAVEAAEADAPVVWDIVAGNVALEGEIGDRQATDAAFAHAAHIVKFNSQIQRVTGVHMEPRTSAASFDAETGRYTLYASGGIGVVSTREQIADCLGLELDSVRVVAPLDVGGNFGTRNATYPEFVLITHAARVTGRPIKHVAERQEAFLSDFQARDLHVDVELALDAEGTFLALRSVNTSNIGAHTVSYTPLNKGAQLMTSLYRVPAAVVTTRAVMTNTPPTIPYRSAGRPEAMYSMERIIDLAARQCGFDRIALRRRNIIQNAEQPYPNPLGITYDNGEYETAMDKAMELADWAGFEERRQEARGRGKYRGIGFGNYIEGTSGMPRERAEITVDSSKAVIDVIVGTQDTGQGHRTAFAQLVASWFGVSHEDVDIRASDTDFVKAGGGSHSGRSLRFCSIVMHEAMSQILQQGRAVVAALFEVTAEEVEFSEGTFKIPGTNQALGLFEAARMAEGGSLRGVGDQITPGLAYPYGAAICEIEIDPETGFYEIPRYTSVDDVGRALNPMIIDGQTHGGIVQGAGQALMEWSNYEAESGQNLSASFMDYALARASDFPSFTTALSEVPANSHPMGFRPGGEGGTTPSLGVVVNAVVDALADLGVTHVEMPTTPLRIWEAIQAAKAVQH